jgi:hypothetical protein
VVRANLSNRRPNRAILPKIGSELSRLASGACAAVLMIIGLSVLPATVSAAATAHTQAAHSSGPSIAIDSSVCDMTPPSDYGVLNIEFFNPPAGANITSFQITGSGQDIHYPPGNYWSFGPGASNPETEPVKIQPGVYNVAVQWQTTGINQTFSNISICGAVATPCVGNGPAPPPITGFAASYSNGVANGYWKADAAGGVSSFGSATFHGSMGGCAINKPVTGMVSTTDGGGYWLVASDGGTFAFGDAGFYGSTGSVHLNASIVSLASTTDNKGYWLVAKDGGIFTYGDAGFYGSTGSLVLNKPVVAMAATPDGGGYWLVASDGGIFAFGDAGFFGSAGSLHLNANIVGMVPTKDGQGYFLVGADGGVFTYGDAQFSGSAGGAPYNPFNPAIGVAPDTQLGNGSYWLAFRDGTVLSYGGAPNDG